jgi:hypothetical protein
MRHGLLIVLLTTLAAGIATAEPSTRPSTQPMTDTISTADFDVSLPRGWRALRSETPGVIMFESADGNARLTVSVADDTAPRGANDSDTDLTKISEIRRQAEMKVVPKVRLSPCHFPTINGVRSSTWRGDDSAEGLQTATLVQLTKMKLLIFYVEALDTPASAVDELAKQVFESIAAR